MPINESPKFLAAFSGFEDYYVLIGGTATAIVLAEYNINSRTTRDYDIVIMDEQKDQTFFKVIINFLEEGEYTPGVSDREERLYRFTSVKEGYPKMIELFCIRPCWLAGYGRIAPVHFEEDMSLSALVLDPEYYDLLKKGRRIRKGYSVLNNEYLIVFKAKAWLDLTKRRQEGAAVDSKNIKKHLNDIARLTGSIKSREKIAISRTIQQDMNSFLEFLESDLSIIPQNEDILLDRQGIFELLNAMLK
ncbi:hypothetical protein [Enterococcus sp. AZ163]|uniref:hypothetical protein n=1 Tax=Enterococcus sp. AZ163 TaxID=2774638 RepID=UPI003D2910D3